MAGAAATANRLARRFPLTLGLLVAITAERAVRLAAPGAASHFEWATSTTVPGLAHHPLLVLVGSVPSVVGGSFGLWLVLVAVAVGGLESTVGTTTALAIGLAGHVGATLVSEGLLGLRVETGGLPRSALDVLDVGPSYVVATALAATALLTRSWPVRIVVGGTAVALAPSFLAGVTAGDLDGVGHTSAFAFGVLAAEILTVRRRSVAAARRQPAAGAPPTWAGDGRDDVVIPGGYAVEPRPDLRAGR